MSGSRRTDELGAINSCLTMSTHARPSASVSDISQSYQQDFKLSLLLLLVPASCMDESMRGDMGELATQPPLIYE